MWEKEEGVEKRASGSRQAGAREEWPSQRQGQGDDSSFENATGNANDVIAFVGKGVEFKGVIKYNGTVRIAGRLEGEIHTDGVLLVEDGAVISAQISAAKVVSRGQITGDIVASEKVNLLAPAVLNGSVKAPLLSIEEGVLFSGTLQMPESGRSEASRVDPTDAVTPIRSATPLKTVAG
ncbi:MAG: polymer-forming cytoskeletal protein [Nitrospirae bacterium]|nr:MAG: polymer-forming cytoskeletal protein [Nitrospirota bacterium]